MNRKEGKLQLSEPGNAANVWVRDDYRRSDMDLLKNLTNE
jgi:hypothetical protein